MSSSEEEGAGETKCDELTANPTPFLPAPVRGKEI